MGLYAYKMEIRQQLIRYLFVGGSTFLLDIVTLTLLKERLGWHPTYAVAINQVLIFAYNFSLNKFWTFNSRPLLHKQWMRYLLLAAGNYTVAVLVMALFTNYTEIDYRLIRVGTIALTTCWTFLLYKFWVYKET